MAVLLNAKISRADHLRHNVALIFVSGGDTVVLGLPDRGMLSFQ